MIPIRRDPNLGDGRPHKKKVWAWLEEELVAFGGATRAPDPYPGWYLDPDMGERVRDLSRKYFVALPRARVGELRSLLRQACHAFCQKCIYLSVAGRVELVEGEGDDAAT